MRSASTMYKILKTAITSWYDVRLLQGVNVYGLDVLRSINISSSLISGSGIDVGNANSSECRVTILEESANWERMAKFTVQFRLVNTESAVASDWITFGSFYTDQRSEDKNGNLSIVAYDKMLMMEQSWTDKIPEALLPASFPITARAWATMIQSAGLATFADLTQLDDTVEFVGLDTSTTIRDVLKSIAAVHAGNWTITPDEELTLVQFVNLDIQTAATDQYLDLALSMQEFSDSPMLDPVTGVHLETDSGTVMEAGDDTGYVLKANCSVSSTAGVAALCLSKIENYVYKPFSSYVSYLDPIAELGDSVAIDGEMYQLMSANWTFTKSPVADVTAPYDQEIDHEYTIPSEQAKSYRKTMAAVEERMGDYVRFDEFSTAIEQNEAAITLVASHTFVDQTTYNEQIDQIQNQLDGNIQSWSGNVVPTLNNLPASDWTTAAARAEHVGDMYFINSDAGIPEAGQYYRFEENNGVYSWQLITDSAITEALAQAAAALAAAETAQDTADAAGAEAQLKGRIFVVQPTPPYAVGDLWFNSDQSEIMTCMTARESGSFVSSDWVKRNKYTDDSALEAFQTLYDATISAIQDQLDQKAETYYQAEDPSDSWVVHPVGIAIVGIDVVGIPENVMSEHRGDLWYRTTDGRTFFWNGTQWVEEQIPNEVFDRIDGKAQIFINTPYTPYNVGDLWFDSANSDIMTCTVARATGDFNVNDWQKRNKYTDDSALTTFVNATYTPAIAAIQSELDGKVDTYFYAYAPTLQNVPASQWTTDAERDAHVDDLFFDTVSGYTYRFTKSGSTYSWERVKDSDITSAMSAASTAQDTADGKRRVFVSQPTNADEYDVGDLWVNATYGSTYSNDLLRCKTHKDAGASFNIAHWDKASKYTDDTTANAVSQALVSFESSFSVEPDKIAAEIAKNVVKDKQSTRTTFGWLLNDTSHTWYANNAEVMKIQQSGLSVTGSITATSGYIGNGSSGFTISPTNIHNGMTSLSDTTNNGVYVGTDGIALGRGRFKVTSGGSVTASDMTITGGSISIKDSSNNVIFSASSAGVYVNGNGTFTGTVYAGNIVSGATVAGAGYFNGSGIVEGTIEGGYGGQIAQYTLEDYNVAQSGGYGAFTTSSFSSGVQTSLYNADVFGLAIDSSSGEYPSYFCASSIRALRGVTGNELYVDYGDETTLSVSNHYHRITVNNDGTVTFGVPYNSNTPPSFNVADTHAYRDAVSAATVTSLDLEYTYDSSMHIYRLMGYAKNQAGTIVYQSTTGQWNTDRSAYVDGKADGADEVTIASITRTYPDGETSYPYYDSPTLGKIIEFKVLASMSNGHGDSETLTVPADAAYNAGYDAGSAGGSGSVTVTSLGFDPNDSVSYSATVNNYYVPIKTVLSNNVSRTTTLTVSGQEAYAAGRTVGQSEGAAGVTITAITRTYPDGESSYPYYDDATLGKIIEFKAQASMSNGQGGSQVLTVPADAAFNAGAQSITVASIGLNTSWATSSTGYVYESANNRYAANIRARLSNDRAWTNTVYIPATDAFNAGSASTSTVLTIASGSVIATTASNYTAYDSGYNFGLSGNLYTSGSYQYGRVQIKNAAGTVLKTMRLVIPASTGSVTSITVSRDHDATTASIADCMADWEISGGNAYVKVNLEAFSGNTSVGTATGRVCVNDFIAYTAPTGATVLATSSASANNNYNWEVDLTGYTNAFYKSGNYQYVRFQLEDNEGYDLDIVRVKMPSTDTAISEVLALTSNSSTYLEYSYQASFYASSLYTPSGSSTTYARVQVNLNSGANQVIRVAIPASSGSTVTDIQSHCTSADYSDYWRNLLGQWMLTVRAMGGNTVLYEKSLNVNHAVNYGGTMSWNIYQHYDMGEADGWDCVVTTNSGETHTFWSPSRIYA